MYFYFRLHAKRKYKDQKFGYGGKKRGIKKNTKNSVNDVSEFRRPGGQKRQRPGKNRRMKMKAKTKK